MNMRERMMMLVVVIDMLINNVLNKESLAPNLKERKMIDKHLSCMFLMCKLA